MAKGLWKRWLEGVERIRESVRERFAQIWSQKSIKPEEWEELEEMLIATDIGPTLALELVTAFRNLKEKARGSEDWKGWLYEKLVSFFGEGEHRLFPGAQPESLRAIFLVGINGVGKTTTAGKLAYLAQREGERVVLISADTFRAAANEQLAIWAERVGCRFFGGSPGADPAAVVYDGLQSALKWKDTLAIVDTAGRSHVNKNLLAELEKVSRVIYRFLPKENVESILVIDALAGQNAFAQASALVRVVPLTGIILTKWDSQAKGGILFRIRREFGLPVKYIGIGEGMDDLIPFDAREFVRAIVF